MREVLINVQVAAAILGLTPDTIRDNPTKYGLVPTRTTGRHRRYRLQDVQEAARRLEEKRQKKVAQ